MLRRLTCVVFGAVAACAVPAIADTPVLPRVGLLAEYVPVDAQLFFEVRDAAGLSRTPAGEALGDVLAWLMGQVKAAESGQAQGTGWKQLIAGALGFRNEQVADLLLSGRVAMAADGWNELPAAVLLAEPADTAAIESMLKEQLVPGTQDERVRRYRLGRDIEIAITGRIVLLGKRKTEADLYARTLDLLTSSRGLCLSDLAEFRERVGEVPVGAQGVFYLGTNLRRQEDASQPVTGWSLIGPRLRSAAVSIEIRPHGLVVETTGRRALPLEAVPTAQYPPIDALLFLPASAVAAWTYPLDYVGELDRLKAAYPQGVVAFYLRLLTWGMKPDALETGLLRHLVGETVFMLGHVAVRPLGGLGDDDILLVPSFALLVEVDDPETVEATLEEMAPNLLRLVNLRSAQESRVAVHAETLSDADESTIVRSIPLATLFPAGTMRELLGSTELSWAVADKRLVLGTHRETVRQIVLAHRGEAPLMPAEAIQQAMRRERSPRRPPETVFVARPGATAEIIDSWLRYIERRHPEMRQPQWWRQLRRQYTASQVQLGIRPAAASPPGMVEIAQTLPDWPAHGRLLPGDRITAVDGRKLDPQRALPSLRNALATRPSDDPLRLTVVRQGRPVEVDIPLASSSSPADHFQPLALLEQVSHLSKMFAFASYVTWQPSRELVQTRLELRLSPAMTAAASGRPAGLRDAGVAPASPSGKSGPASAAPRPDSPPAASPPPAGPTPLNAAPPAGR
ncbi:MAG TPA: PDZ domain-containing protein [Phycisphaerae bacterium]|nr:PDZ domain-containing protein [Phycisphaerae bacterium]